MACDKKEELAANFLFDSMMNDGGVAGLGISSSIKEDEVIGKSDIIKSESDNRLYKYIKLDNGLRCLLIQDNQNDFSAASLDLRVGSALDPKEINGGTAHFLEHMLLQGTEKYPGVNEFDKVVKDNGGFKNAKTTLTDTSYFFDCKNEAFEKVLDMLA